MTVASSLINIISTVTAIYISQGMSYCFTVKCSEYLAGLGIGWDRCWLSKSNCHLVVQWGRSLQEIVQTTKIHMYSKNWSLFFSFMSYSIHVFINMFWQYFRKNNKNIYLVLLKDYFFVIVNSKHRNISLFLCVIVLKPLIWVDFFKIRPKHCLQENINY